VEPGVRRGWWHWLRNSWGAGAVAACAEAGGAAIEALAVKDFFNSRNTLLDSV